MANTKLEQIVPVPTQTPTIGTSEDRSLASLDTSKLLAIYLRPDHEVGFQFEQTTIGEDVFPLAALEILRESTQGDDSFAFSVAAILSSLGSSNDLILFISPSLVQQSAQTRLVELLGNQIRRLALGRFGGSSWQANELNFASSLWLQCISDSEWDALRNGAIGSLRVMSDQTYYWLSSEEAGNDSDRLKSTIHESRVFEKDIPSMPAILVEGPHFRGAQDRQLCQYFDEMLEKKNGTNWSSSLSLVEARRIVDKYKTAIDSSPYWEAVAAFVRDYDEVSKPITTGNGVLGIGQIRKSRSQFLSTIQRDLDSAVGMGGEDFLTLIRELVPVLNASGLLVRPIGSAKGHFQFELGEKGVCLNDIAANSQSEPLKRFPKVKVIPIEELNIQATRNDLASKNIKLLSVDQVSKLNARAYFEYFDQVHEHVDREELARQLQNWLDAFPEKERDFGKNKDAKRAFASNLNARAKQIGLRFECSVCKAPSGLSVVVTGNSTSGQFFYSHRNDKKRVMHARSSILPKLKFAEDSPSPIK